MEAEIVDRFGRIESRVSGLEATTGKLDRWVQEESVPFHRSMRTFVDGFQATEKERDRVQAQRHAENIETGRKTNGKLVLYGTIIALFGLICAVCMLILAVKAAQHAHNDPAGIFHSPGQSQTVVEARNELAF